MECGAPCVARFKDWHRPRRSTRSDFRAVGDRLRGRGATSSKHCLSLRQRRIPLPSAQAGRLGVRQEDRNKIPTLARRASEGVRSIPRLRVGVVWTAGSFFSSICLRRPTAASRIHFLRKPPALPVTIDKALSLPAWRGPDAADALGLPLIVPHKCRSKKRRYPGPNVSQAVDSLSWPRRTLYVCRKTLPHSLLPRRGRNMSAQGKQPRVLRAVARPWVTGNKIPNSPERAQQSPRTGAAVPLRRAAQRGALDGVSRRCSAFVLVADDPGLRTGVYLARHLLRPFRALR